MVWILSAVATLVLNSLRLFGDILTFFRPDVEVSVPFQMTGIHFLVSIVSHHMVSCC